MRRHEKAAEGGEGGRGDGIGITKGWEGMPMTQLARLFLRGAPRRDET